jgi:hypothetical protein
LISERLTWRRRTTLGSDLESLFVSNYVSLATHVRIDIMKAIARKITNRDDLAYVAGFSSRPMLHIRRAGPLTVITKPIKSFTFVDSVTKIRNRLGIDELETAYGRAGTSFNGQLQQNFIVLNERDQGTPRSFATARGGGHTLRGG